MNRDLSAKHELVSDLFQLPAICAATVAACGVNSGCWNMSDESSHKRLEGDLK